MANIHQTMKRVAALYEDLIGTREEIARCVQELHRWQQEEREWRRRSQEETRTLVQEAVKKRVQSLENSSGGEGGKCQSSLRDWGGGPVLRFLSL